MKTLKSYLAVIFICIFAALLIWQNGETGKVIRGGRPPVDLRSLTMKAMKPGVVLIKFTENHIKQLEVNLIERNGIFLI